MYAKCIDNARKAVAIALVICGVAFVVCMRQDDYLRETLRRDSGPWGWAMLAFAIGICGCLLATAVLISESLFCLGKRRTLRPLESFGAGLLGVAACVVVVAGLVEWHNYSERAHQKRLKALSAIERIGGEVQRDFKWKDEVEGKFLEIDMRNARLTDAEVEDIITLDPTRLRLGSTQLSKNGLQRLHQALPNSDIELEPPDQPGP
jgi:hypothetical protein